MFTAQSMPGQDGGGAASGAEYDLVSVVAHHGSSLTSGHYTAYVRGGGDRWFHLDDSRVSPVSADTVLACEAYVLFYERKQSPSHAQHRRQIMSAISKHQSLIKQQQGRADAMEVDGDVHGELGADCMLLSKGWFARYAATDR